MSGTLCQVARRIISHRTHVSDISIQEEEMKITQLQLSHVEWSMSHVRTCDKAMSQITEKVSPVTPHPSHVCTCDIGHWTCDDFTLWYIRGVILPRHLALIAPGTTSMLHPSVYVGWLKPNVTDAVIKCSSSSQEEEEKTTQYLWDCWQKSVKTQNWIASMEHVSLIENVLFVHLQGDLCVQKYRWPWASMKDSSAEPTDYLIVSMCNCGLWVEFHCSLFPRTDIYPPTEVLPVSGTYFILSCPSPPPPQFWII